VPNPQHTPTMIALRKATIEKIYDLTEQLGDDPTPHGRHYSDRMKTLLDLYFGTVPPTYRGDASPLKKGKGLRS
jgi:hypothetical protein